MKYEYCKLLMSPTPPLGPQRVAAIEVDDSGSTPVCARYKPHSSVDHTLRPLTPSFSHPNCVSQIKADTCPRRLSALQALAYLPPVFPASAKDKLCYAVRYCFLGRSAIDPTRDPVSVIADDTGLICERYHLLSPQIADPSLNIATVTKEQCDCQVTDNQCPRQVPPPGAKGAYYAGNPPDITRLAKLTS